MRVDTDRARIEAAQDDDGQPVSELIERYRRGPDAVRAATRGLTGAQLLSRPVAGKMSTQEVVGHIADADQYLADRLKRTIATDRPLLVGVESALYPLPLHYHKRDIELDLDLLAVTRAQMASDLDRLAEDAWLRTAVHTETGLVTLRQLLLHAIRHLEGHVDAIDEKRAALGL